MRKILTVQSQPVRVATMTHAVTSASRLHWGMLPVVIFSARQLVQICVAVCVILAAVCVGIIATEHLNPDRASSFELTHCGDLPCFRGIIAGRTSWSDAMSIFNGQSMVQADPLSRQIIFFPSVDKSTVDAILLNQPFSPAMNVGEILLTFGIPACVEINRTAKTLILHYPDLHILSRFKNNLFNADTVIVSVVLGKIASSTIEQKPVCSQINLSVVGAQTSQHVWQGFASMQHYLSAIG